MAQLTVRKLDKELVAALKIRAARNGRSAEAEHREILKHALTSDDFKQHLLQLADLADVAFPRIEGAIRDVEL